MPKYCTCNETHTLYFLSKQEFIIEMELKVSGVPLSDCFISYMRWKVSGEEKSFFDIKYGVDIIKSTIFRNKIESSGTNEARVSINTVWIPLAKRKMQAIQGNPPAEIINLPIKQEENSKESYIFYTFLGFALIILLLLYKVYSLQRQLDSLHELILTNVNKK